MSIQIIPKFRHSRLLKLFFSLILKIEDFKMIPWYICTLCLIGYGVGVSLRLTDFTASIVWNFFLLVRNYFIHVNHTCNSPGVFFWSKVDPISQVFFSLTIDVNIKGLQIFNYTFQAKDLSTKIRDTHTMKTIWQWNCHYLFQQLRTRLIEL